MTKTLCLTLATTWLITACGAPPPGGTGGAGGSSGASGARCDVTQANIVCRSKPIVTIATGADSRRVYWNDPLTAAPASGWPAVVLYQGSFFGPSVTWDVPLARGTTPFGGDVQVELVATLIERGFVVIQPEAPGGIAWNTNIGGAYEGTADAVFIPKLLDEMARGRFGHIDMTRLYAAGISSGGYMTSRMAVSYPGRFRALAIQSGSYATCLGPLCSVPAVLPQDHPPTLFLHGGADLIVGIATARDYYNKLQTNRITTKFVENPTADHRWITAAPSEILAWFTTH
ncbi:MAG TPA: prolyl oligopeptidase family serine peptidase [Polyangiaceae bacterium]|nr:prolyl oligopeptidase family serine peptidase [Polyangiaceae bacterium]